MSYSATRRTLLSDTFSVSAALFLGGFSTQLAALPRRQVALDDAAFLALSRHLTGHETLNAKMGSALLAALRQAGFSTALDQLYDAVAMAGGDAAATITAAHGHAEATEALLRGWYIGVVRMPGAEQAHLVGYEHALMFEPLRDWLKPRSWCGGAPHFWADPPKVDSAELSL